MAKKEAFYCAECGAPRSQFAGRRCRACYLRSPHERRFHRVEVPYKWSPGLDGPGLEFSAMMIRLIREAGNEALAKEWEDDLSKLDELARQFDAAAKSYAHSCVVYR